MYRYAAELLDVFHNRNDLDLYFAHTANPVCLKYAEYYLRNMDLFDKMCNKLANPLPRNLMGRGERYYNKLYRLFHIDIDKILYNDQLFSSAEVYHTPFNPILPDVKKYKNLARVITIHDLYPIINPHTNESGKRLMKNLIASIGEDYAICVSNNTKNDLLNFDNQIRPEHVFVSHLAADPRKFYPCNDKNRLLHVKKKYNLPDKYFLSLCTLEPRKNLSHLIKCFIKFTKEQHIKDLYLVLAGSKGWDIDHLFMEVINAGSLKNKILVIGRIPDSYLATVYSNAHSFYFMSLYEGFGLPALEAMQCGVPTVTSNNSSLPEVVGDGGILLDPHDEDAMCDTMYKLYYQEDFRFRLKDRGLKRAQNFSWEKCASSHINIYQQVKSF